MIVRSARIIVLVALLAAATGCGAVTPAATPQATSAWSPSPAPGIPAEAASPLQTPLLEPEAPAPDAPSGEALYLGQTPPGLVPEVFAPGIVSIDDGKEYNITISPDLQQIVFTRRTPGGSDDRLWISRLEGGKLTVPEPAPFGYDGLETDACFTPDGSRLIFKSARPLPSGTARAGAAMMSAWFVDRTETGWGEPQVLGPPLSDYDPVYFSFANDGTVYFTRSTPRSIWYAESTDGQFLEAESMPNEINYLSGVAHPAVAPDGGYIIVDAEAQPGGPLDSSLYVSFKQADGSWTRATSLHSAMQASEADVYAMPRITPDGRFLFFERYEAETDRSDIYWVSTDLVRDLNPAASDSATTDSAVPDPAEACPPARGAGIVAPAVAIYSMTFAVDGEEQVVREGDTLKASPGQVVQVRDVTICTGSFSGDGGEACVDLVPVRQSGQEIASEHGGTHMLRLKPGFTTMAGPDRRWTVDGDWGGFAVVLNHWPPGGSEDPSCGDGRCERDDRLFVGFGGSGRP